MDRTIIYSQEQPRSFDFVQFEHDILRALGFSIQDILGSTTTVVSGFAATQTSPATLAVNIAAGRCYQQAYADAVSVGAISQDLTVIEQQGSYAGAQITLSTTGISAGQSRWSLIEAQFSQSDIVRANDPNGGIPPFYNSANPSQPLNGQGGLGLTSPTERAALCVIQVITGAAATTGSEAPPTPTTGWVPLYLVDLTYGQTQVTTSQVIPTGPSIGTGVPNNYPVAPFIAGLLNSHHNGAAGQAPKINLTSEVQGYLPTANGGYPRITLTGNVAAYINGSTGNDANNGLTSGTAWRTLQGAWNFIMQNYDLGGFSMTINVANGTYAPVMCSGTPVGSGTISFVGNVTTPSSCLIAATNTSAFTSSSSATIDVSGFEVTATGTAAGQGCGVYADTSGAVVNIVGNMLFGSCAVADLAVSGCAQIYVGSSYSTTGTSGAAWLSSLGGTLTGGTSGVTITLSATPTFTNGFAVASGSGSNVQCAAVTAFSGAANGPRYLAQYGGFVSTNTANTSFLPGSSAGSSSTGYYN